MKKIIILFLLCLSSSIFAVFKPVLLDADDIYYSVDQYYRNEVLIFENDDYKLISRCYIPQPIYHDPQGGWISQSIYLIQKKQSRVYSIITPEYGYSNLLKKAGDSLVASYKGATAVLFTIGNIYDAANGPNPYYKKFYLIVFSKKGIYTDLIGRGVSHEEGESKIIPEFKKIGKKSMLNIKAIVTESRYEGNEFEDGEWISETKKEADFNIDWYNDFVQNPVIEKKMIYGRMNNSNVRFRTEPNLDCSIIKLLDSSSSFRILSRSKNKQKIDKMNSYWYKIRLWTGEIGWVYGFFVDLEK